MVTLQILVLSFLVRIRVSQHSASSKFHSSTLGYGVMVTLQILVLSFLVRIRVSQPYALASLSDEGCFFCISQCLMLDVGKMDKTKNASFAKYVKDAFFILCYLFSASIALIFCFTISKSLFNFSTFLFISSTRLFPFLLAALRNPRLFS